jgi:hypothetical protein
MNIYRPNDKVVLKETGEVFTVHEDLSHHQEPGIIVKENMGIPLLHCDVKPAGHTRQRADLARSITEPESPPPLPDNCVRLANPENLVAELTESQRDADLEDQAGSVTNAEM